MPFNIISVRNAPPVFRHHFSHRIPPLPFSRTENPPKPQKEEDEAILERIRSEAPQAPSSQSSPSPSSPSSPSRSSSESISPSLKYYVIPVPWMEGALSYLLSSKSRKEYRPTRGNDDNADDDDDDDGPGRIENGPLLASTPSPSPSPYADSSDGNGSDVGDVDDDADRRQARRERWARKEQEQEQQQQQQDSASSGTSRRRRRRRLRLRNDLMHGSDFVLVGPSVWTLLSTKFGYDHAVTADLVVGIVEIQQQQGWYSTVSGTVKRMCADVPIGTTRRGQDGKEDGKEEEEEEEEEKMYRIAMRNGMSGFADYDGIMARIPTASASANGGGNGDGDGDDDVANAQDDTMDDANDATHGDGGNDDDAVSQVSSSTHPPSSLHCAEKGLDSIPTGLFFLALSLFLGARVSYLLIRATLAPAVHLSYLIFFLSHLSFSMYRWLPTSLGIPYTTISGISRLWKPPPPELPQPPERLSRLWTSRSFSWDTPRQHRRRRR